MRVAVVGGGISGLVSAYVLANNGVEVVVYEKEDYLGGHANTVTFGGLDLDLGFMVFNRVGYSFFSFLACSSNSFTFLDNRTPKKKKKSVWIVLEGIVIFSVQAKKKKKFLHVLLFLTLFFLKKTYIIFLQNKNSKKYIFFRKKNI